MHTLVSIYTPEAGALTSNRTSKHRVGMKSTVPGMNDGWMAACAWPAAATSRLRVGPHMHPFGVAIVAVESVYSCTLNHRACNRACFLSTPATAVPVRACMTARMCVQRVEYSCTVVAGGRQQYCTMVIGEGVAVGKTENKREVSG